MVSRNLTHNLRSSQEAAIAGRRGFLRMLIWAAAGGVAASVLTLVKVVVPRKTGGYTPTVKAGDILIYAEGSKRGGPIRLDDLQVGDSALCYPKGKESNHANIIRVIREESELFQPPTRIDWTDRGVVAYSAICTHLSCTVSWEKASQPKASVILCHCHNGLYNPLRGAKVMGGPPPRSLPQIGVKVDDEGGLRIKSGFAGPVGPIL